ncbi:MAG: hemerythrin domain-containing protein [Proteobacteria bacterium]|nr:hemerythrin domain-containing protein [Pseudomonadota bacterium]
MEKQLPSQWLEIQHRDIDAGVAGLLDGSRGANALLAALRLLRTHIHIEEQVLFPPLKAAGLTMPVFVMKREHAQMWALLAQLDAACGADAPADDLKALARTLFQLLQMHNNKEEQIVYAAADRLVDADGSTLTLKALQDARMPEGWTCALAAP